MRHLLNLTAVVSLLIAALIAAMCVRAIPGDFYTSREVAYYRGPGAQVTQDDDDANWFGYTIYIHWRHIEWPIFGKAGLDSFHADHPPQPMWFFGHVPKAATYGLFPLSRGSIWAWLGFYWTRYDVPGGNTKDGTMCTFPAWIFLPPLVGFGVLTLRKHWWLYRKDRGRMLCRRCGYDLRATSDRCPECGTATAASAR